MTTNNSYPSFWQFKGGRHNAAYRHEGANDLWYITQIWGAGRFEQAWRVIVLPKSVRPTRYAGGHEGIVVLPFLPKALLVISGKGGHVSGKGFMSKGGARQAYDRPYIVDSCEGVIGLYALSHVAYCHNNSCEFTELLKVKWKVELSVKVGKIHEPDTMLSDLGITPSIKGLQASAQVEADILALNASYQSAVELEAIDIAADRLAAKKVYDALIAKWEGIFDGMSPLPSGFGGAIDKDGYHVWYDGFASFKNMVFESIESYESWRCETIAQQLAQAKAQALRESEEAARQLAESQRIESVVPKIGAMGKALSGLK